MQDDSLELGVLNVSVADALSLHPREVTDAERLLAQAEVRGALVFRYQLEIELVNARLDDVLSGNDTPVQFTDEQQEVERRMAEIMEKRTLSLVCGVHIEAEEEELREFQQLGTTPVPFTALAKTMLRTQVEADVKRELEWQALGLEGQEASISATLGTLADAGHFLGLRDLGGGQAPPQLPPIIAQAQDTEQLAAIEALLRGEPDKSV